MFGVAERAYFKACDTSNPEDWHQAGLMAQQHRNALAKARACLTQPQTLSESPLTPRQEALAGEYVKEGHSMEDALRIARENP
jgi:hypothetical protein